MSRFFAELMGVGKVVTRVGSATSGLWAHLRGRDIGINVRVYVNSDGEDEVLVHLTGGSNAPNDLKLVFTDANTGDRIVLNIEQEYRFVLSNKSTQLRVDD